MSKVKLAIILFFVLGGCFAASAQLCYRLEFATVVTSEDVGGKKEIYFMALPPPEGAPKGLPPSTSIEEKGANGSTKRLGFYEGTAEAAQEDYEKRHCSEVIDLTPFLPNYPEPLLAVPAAANPNSNSAVPQSAQAAVVDDFNGDGIPDSATIVGSRFSIALLDNNGNPAGGSSYTLPGQGATVISVDVNGDSKPDLVVTLLNPPGGVAVLLGNGNGTFQQPKTYAATGLDTFSVAAGDFNGDGKLDLAVTSNICFGSGSNGVAVLLGNGDGSFRAPVNYAAGGCPQDLVALDLNGDGKLDLAVTDSLSQNIYVLPGRGDGTFNSAISSPANGSPGSISYGDLNRDGIPDLALLMGGSNTIAILLGKGDGTFQAPVHYAAGADASTLALQPTADGAFVAFTPDLAATAILALPGTAQGTLKSPVVQFVHAASQPAIADVTGDGKPDIVLVDSTPNLLVLPGDGTGNFGAPVSFPLNAPDGYSATGGTLAIGDLNGDGIADVGVPVGFIGTVSANGGIGVMLGKKGGGFQSINVTQLSDTSLSVVMGDFNNDGKLDIAVRGSSGISVLPGNGDGTFKPPVATAIAPGITPGGVTVGIVAAGDFNRDGKLDLFVVGPSGPVVLPGNGAGGFGAPIPIPLTGMGVTSAAVADLNADGIPDIAVADVNSVQAAILLGKGDGTFRISSPIITDTNPFGLALGDLNGDGYPDLTLAHCCGALEDVIYFNNGDGTFGAGFHVPSGPSAYYLAAGDLTGTGKLGIVSVANVFGNPHLRGAVTVVHTGTAGSPAQPVSAAPAAGNGTAQKFTFTFLHSGGYQNLSVVDVLINNALDGRHACYVAFMPSGATGGSVFLIDDAGDAGGPFQGLVLPGSGTIANSQCTINGSGSSAAASGNILRLTLSITFAGAFGGNKVFYLSARDNSGNNSGWQSLGTWGVPGAQTVGPAVGGVTPASGDSLLQTYQFTFTDSNGWQDIAVANILVNSAIDGRHACYIAFVPSGPSSGSVFLVDDAGDAAGPFAGLQLPGSGTVNNSQCFIDASGASVSAGGTTLIVTLPITFDTGFAGNQIVFLATRSNTATSNWQAVGMVRVP